jgi:hypothetical protein
MYVHDSSIAGQLARLGNAQGDQKGLCHVTLPGGERYACASASLHLYAEGLTGELGDGRRFFAHVSGVLVMDAPRADDGPAPDAEQA